MSRIIKDVFIHEGNHIYLLRNNEQLGYIRYQDNTVRTWLPNIFIIDLQVNITNRRQGVATALIQELINTYYNYTIALMLVDGYGTDIDILEHMYKDLGFINLEGSDSLQIMTNYKSNILLNYTDEELDHITTDIFGETDYYNLDIIAAYELQELMLEEDIDINEIKEVLKESILAYKLTFY